MQKSKIIALKDFMDEKVDLFNQPSFIENDPIQIPHRFEQKEDIEIAAFLTSTIAWGRREMITKSANKMMEMMDHSPFDFVMNHSAEDLETVQKFTHRTFNGFDFQYFISALNRIYTSNGGLEAAFASGLDVNKHIDMQFAITHFNELFFDAIPDKFRTRKHVANPAKGSAAKRMIMFLRWMVRKDNKKVDFGLWNIIPMSHLSCPLDVHTGNVGRSLGFITRTQNDWKTVEELDSAFRILNPADPARYDFALFGLGAMEGWGKLK